MMTMFKVVLILLYLLINIYSYSQDDKSSALSEPVEVDFGESDMLFFDSSTTGKTFSGTLSDITFSPDGRYIIGYSQAGELKVYDVYNKNCIFSTKVNSEIILAQISSDNKFIFIISKDKSFKIIRIEDSFIAYKETYSILPADLKVSKDGQYAAVGSDTVRIYKQISGWQKVFETQKINDMFVNSLTFSKDGELLIAAIDNINKTGNNNFIEVYEYKKGKYITNQFFRDQYLPWINKIEITPDSKVIFAALDDDTIKGFERIKTRINPMNIFDSGSLFKTKIKLMKLSNNGQYVIASSTGNIVKVFDVNKNKLVFDSKDYFDSAINDIGFSKNDRYFAVSFGNHNTSVYDLPTGTLFMEVLGGDHYESASPEPGYFDYSSNNKYIAKSSGSGIIKVYKLVKFFSKKNSSVDISNEALSQIKAIFNKHFDGLKEGDVIFFYQKDISPGGVPVYHVRLKLKNGNVMLVRTTTAFNEYKYLFDAVDFENNEKLSVNIIVAESMNELDKGKTVKGDWNSIAGKLLKPDSKEVKEIKNR